MEMTLSACERRAKDDGAYDKATFDLVGPTGRIKCRWLDAYFGIFKQVDEEGRGFLMARDFDVPDIHVENYSAEGG